MMKLTKESFKSAQRFLMTEARPLERTLFEYHFEGGPAGAVMKELTAFQNKDGGFGRALEPDLRTPSSSALATGIGLRLLKELGYSSEEPMVRRAVSFLQNTLDRNTWVWSVAPEDSNDHPHAPWWHDEAGSLARTFDDFLVIPRAELVALLIHYRPLVPAAWLTELTERTLRDLLTIEALGTGGGDDLVYALRLAEAAPLPGSCGEQLLARLRDVVPQVVSRDPVEWSGYCITPLKVAPSPQSVVADLLGDLLNVHLDYLIENQDASGGWNPVWSWGDAYPEEWATARREWQGCLTLDNLVTLRSYGRLE
jgi:hypothetical protein